MSETNAISARLPVLYRSVTPLNRETHRHLRLAPLPEPLSFARGTHLLPAMLDEFAAAARELPIVFLPEGEMISCVFLLSLKPGVNGFVNGDGMWTADYLPAYIRRYPFILADVDTGGDPLMCFDDQFEGLGDLGGEPLFKPDGAATPALEAAMQFAAGFREAGQRTTAFIAKLREFDLLTAVKLDVASKRAGKASVEGLLVVSEARLKALSDARLLELQRSGHLPAIYAHLMSLGALTTLS